MGYGLAEKHIGRGSLNIFLVNVTVFHHFGFLCFVNFSAPFFFLFLGAAAAGAAPAGSWPTDPILSIGVKWETVAANVQRYTPKTPDKQRMEAERFQDSKWSLPSLIRQIEYFPPKRVYSHIDNINYLGEGLSPILSGLYLDRNKCPIMPECSYSTRTILKCGVGKVWRCNSIWILKYKPDK